MIEMIKISKMKSIQNKKTIKRRSHHNLSHLLIPSNFQIRLDRAVKAIVQAVYLSNINIVYQLHIIYKLLAQTESLVK